MLELTLDSVTKKYGKKTAVNGISCTLTRGVYGLLGANGSGKTTFLETTEGAVLYGGGAIRSLGARYRRILGYLPQDFGYYPEFTAKRFLLYLAALKAIPKDEAGKKVEELLGLVRECEPGQGAILAELAPWVEDCFREQEVFTIIGM